MPGYNLKPYSHNGQAVQIPFTQEAFFNATIAAKAFGKTPKDWLRTDDTKSYIDAVRRKCLFEHNQLVRVVQGSPDNGGGTWFHPKLGIPFARWLNPDFAVWADEQIEMILHGANHIIPRSFADALQLATNQARLLEAQGEQITVMTPKADYYDRLMGTHETVDLETAAKTLRTSRPRLISFLKDRGILTKKCLPTQPYIDRDYMRINIKPYHDQYGVPRLSEKTVITQAGLLYVRGLLDTLEHEKARAKDQGRAA